MDITSSPSYSVTLSIAGDIGRARQLLVSECWREGLCVTVTPTTFVYSGGVEEGMRIGFVNYPRFPKTPEEIFQRAEQVARLLVDGLCQRTALIETPEQTYWLRREVGAN